MNNLRSTRTQGESHLLLCHSNAPPQRIGQRTAPRRERQLHCDNVHIETREVNVVHEVLFVGRAIVDTASAVEERYSNAASQEIDLGRTGERLLHVDGRDEGKSAIVLPPAAEDEVLNGRRGICHREAWEAEPNVKADEHSECDAVRAHKVVERRSRIVEDLCVRKEEVELPMLCQKCAISAEGELGVVLPPAVAWAGGGTLRIAPLHFSNVNHHSETVCLRKERSIVHRGGGPLEFFTDSGADVGHLLEPGQCPIPSLVVTLRPAGDAVLVEHNDLCLVGCNHHRVLVPPEVEELHSKHVRCLLVRHSLLSHECLHLSKRTGVLACVEVHRDHLDHTPNVAVALRLCGT
mmetsp:Transcript_19370/g.74387  ORF Transcript_19370/g.74387 Transcript_19370/m.74387 type:complete len:350 (+) Transcript_19370:577-1626(+)